MRDRHTVRLDRAVTLLAFRAMASLTSTLASVRLPVLMYHSVSATPETATPYYRVSTHPDVFAQQMQMLEREGYAGVTLSRGLQALHSPDPELAGRQPVALTFDDGYRDFLTAAVPVLDRHGFTATMYVPTGYIGHDRREFKGRECLTWREVARLHDAGFEFGSHTVTHRRLDALTWDEIRSELVVSKQTLEQHVHTEVTAFAYPYAFPQQRRAFRTRFMELLTDAAYRSSVTTIIGSVHARDDALSLKRLPVNSCDDPALLRAKVRGFYNWMAAPQAASKQLALWRSVGGRTRA